MIRRQSEEQFRALVGDSSVGVSLRAAEQSSSVMAGRFAVWDSWTEINSWWEGNFMERLKRGAFAKTIAENLSNVRVQFDHGCDYHIGSAPLGPVADIREDDIGVYYEVPLLDTDYNRDRILPLLAGRTIDGEDHGSLLGASFRFRVLKEEIEEEPGESSHNPKGLPERTITEVRLMEFGPVVFPAYPDATAGLRSVSLSDRYLKDLRASGADSFTPPSGTVEPLDEHSADHTGFPIWGARKRLAALD